MSSPKIIKNQSKGYGYTYNNLADLARAGVEIPPMKTAIVEGREYVFAKIGDEWIQGAQVIDIDMERSEQVRRWWPFLRDRRIECYGDLDKRFLD